MDGVEIGNDIFFGGNVKLYDHNHRFRNKELTIEPQGYSTGRILIGNRCWFGSNVVNLKNVSIGDNVVVVASCVISKNTESNTIVKYSKDMLIKTRY